MSDITNEERRRLGAYASSLARAERDRNALMARRDALIRRIRERGATIPAIVDAAGLSQSRVEQIVFGRRERGQ